MIKRKVNINIGWIFLLGVFLGLTGMAWAADEPAGMPENDQKDAAGNTGSGKSQEVVIKGVQRLKVKAVKPEPEVNFDVDEIAVPYVISEDDVMDVSPTSSAAPAVVVVDKLNSQQTASPYIQIFQTPPILTLNPKYNNKISIVRWRLRITDGFGNVFRDFTGDGSLPQQIVWDGMGKNNTEMVEVGTSYSYIFSIIDVASNPTSSIGKPIILESLMYPEGSKIICKVVADVFFTKQGRKTGISDKGLLYLRQVADLLTSRQNYPLEIEAFAKDADDAEYKAEMIQEQLAERLIIPKERIKIKGKKANLEKIVFIVH